ncbi:MAG: histidinol phosphate phosphatase [Alphaproteobacteria bacterium]|nr:histidinol phosphate phosphatase [Alphaproteobacteria bacterium]
MVSGPDTSTISSIADLATSLTKLSRPIIASSFRLNPELSQKSDASPVTVADVTVEKTLREAIHSVFPDHNIIGEEHGETTNNSPFTWVIDPIDGTRAFSCGNPMFGTLIAVLHENNPVIGIIDLPMMHQTWIGIDGQDTRLNGELVTTSSQTMLDQARLTTTSGHALGGDYPRFEQLSRATMVTGFGGDCANYAHLAAGWCDLVAESHLNAHDIMAAIPVINGAGGRITQWDGRAITLDGYDGTALASATPSLHDKAIIALSLQA